MKLFNFFFFLFSALHPQVFGQMRIRRKGGDVIAKPDSSLDA